MLKASEYGFNRRIPTEFRHLYRDHKFRYNFTEGVVPGIDSNADSYYSIDLIIINAAECANDKARFSEHQLEVLFSQLTYAYWDMDRIPADILNKLPTIINKSLATDDIKNHYNGVVESWKVMMG